MKACLKENINWMIHRRKFRAVATFCLFAGYPRSGHSLVGALMDAHPDMMISHELDVLEMVRKGSGFRNIFVQIAKNSSSFARSGRSWSGYSYAVPGQWQGRSRTLKVLGDKRGGRTSLLLMDDFSLIDKLQQRLPVPVKIIHVVRNPFDNIVTRAMQGNDVRLDPTPDRINEQIELHFLQAAVIQRLIDEGICPVLTLRHEEMVTETKLSLRQICDFMNVEAESGWLKACAAIVFDSPRKTRSLYSYTVDEIALIRQHIAKFPFLAGYDHDEN